MRLLQRLAFLHRESLRLCPVFFEGRLVLRGEGPEDVLHRIDAMLARGSPPHGYQL
jgi:hypothetical protein